MSGKRCARRNSRWRSIGLIYSFFAVLILILGTSANVDAMGIDPSIAFYKRYDGTVTPGWGWSGPELVAARRGIHNSLHHLEYDPPTWVGFGHAVAVDASGDWVIAYGECVGEVDFSTLTGTSTTSIHLTDASSSDETVASAVFWAEYPDTCGGQCVGSPSIAFDSLGALHIAYVWTDVETSAASIMYVRRTANGTFSPPQTVVSGIPAVELTSGMSHGCDNFNHGYWGLEDWGLQGGLSAAEALFWGRQIPLVSIAADAAGNWYISYVRRQYEDIGEDSFVNCSLIVVGIGGAGPWTLANSQMITPESGWQTGSEICCSSIDMDDTGELHVAYVERICTPEGMWHGSPKGAVRYSHGLPGQPFSAPETVARATQAWVSITVDDTGNWMIAYPNILDRNDPDVDPTWTWTYMSFAKMVGRDFAPRTLSSQYDVQWVMKADDPYVSIGPLEYVDLDLTDYCNPHAVESFCNWDYNSSDVVHDVRIDCSQPEAYELMVGMNKAQFPDLYPFYPGGTTSLATYTRHAYAPGSIAEVEATPAEGVQFIGWQGAVETSDNPVQIVMDGDKEIEAIFGLPLETSVAGQGSVQLDPPGGVYRPYSRVQATAVPASGWRLAYWVTAADTYAFDNPTYVNTTPAYVRSIQAVFLENTGEQWRLATSAAGYGSVTTTPATIVHPHGSEVAIKAFPGSSRVFDHWEGDLTGEQNPTSLIMDADKSVTAVFSTGGYRLDTNVVGEGSIEVDPATIWHNIGSEPSLEAVPASGWEFDHWEGDLGGDQNPETVTMDGDKTVTAVFAKVPTVDVTIQGEGDVVFHLHHGPLEQAALVATPASGWRFDHWEGDLDGTSAIRYFEWQEGMEVTAVFVELEPGSITGIVTDMHTGDAMAGAEVTATGAGKQSAVSDSDGRYTITGLTAGVYSVRAAAPSYLDLVKQVAVGTGPGSIADFTLSLVTLPTLSVTPLIRSVDVSAGSAFFTVESPGGAAFAYEAAVEEEADWLAVADGAAGRNGDTITVAFEENATGQTRTANVIVTSPGSLDSPFYVALVQLGTPAEPGDIDTNGLTNAVDIQLVINAALGAACEHTCDVDGNGKVDAVDIQLVINAALGVTP